MKMELPFPSLPLFFPLLFIFTVFLIMKKSNTHKLPLPPGPWKLPIIGNIHNVLGSLPHHSLHNVAKKFGPIMHLQLGEVNAIIVSSPEIAKEIMKTHDVIFASRPFIVALKIIFGNTTDVAFAPYGEFWRQMRKICVVEILSAKRVQSFRPIREEEILNAIKEITCSEGSMVNISKVLLSYAYNVILRAAFGKITEEQEALIPLIKDAAEVSAGFSIADLFPSIKLIHNLDGMRSRTERAYQEADKIIDTVINYHKLRRKASSNKISDQESNDLIDVLLNIQEQENLDFTLTTENLKGVILDVFLGGTETSSTVIEWALSEMMKNPRVMEKAQVEVRRAFGKKEYVDEESLGELNYLKLVIKETLRLHPPLALLLPRESREECEINGFRIPNESKVIVNAWAIGRDPKYWSEAESFIPERFSDGTVDYRGANFEFIPFGSGRRMCPGITFGMVNIEVPLANLLYYFDWKLPDGMKPEDIDMTEAAGTSVRRKNSLNLVPIVRHPLPSVV
ncbi:desmethyl-deoxy-podophyllotoxin synthase [Ricinus communis]|uniref:desmethyl-deoxy-podophyllotoxin synthase n=1 Tax=Ricinus communis TaxID=3988 RepID=UPI00201B26D8|nr:desmethyl-deoxy-podophyllotoxin synthase [Ricinus communis]